MAKNGEKASILWVKNAIWLEGRTFTQTLRNRWNEYLIEAAMLQQQQQCNRAQAPQIYIYGKTGIVERIPMSTELYNT